MRLKNVYIYAQVLSAINITERADGQEQNLCIPQSKYRICADRVLNRQNCLESPHWNRQKCFESPMDSASSLLAYQSLSRDTTSQPRRVHQPSRNHHIWILAAKWSLEALLCST